jgi:hypothetical protein
MKARTFFWVVTIPILFNIIACSTIKVTPPLNMSLGMDAFENMKKIDTRNVSLALYIDSKIKQLQVTQQIHSVEFSFPVGKAFSTKMIKALAYNFKTLYFIEEPSYKGTDPADSIMRVILADVDLNTSLTGGGQFSTVSAESYMRLSIRATIDDIGEKKTVWVGATQAKESGLQQAFHIRFMPPHEAGRGFATTIDSAIDKAIGDLINQMRESKELNEYIFKWEQKHKGGN